jgi:hypothetical protein
MSPALEIRRKLSASKNLGPAPQGFDELLGAWDLMGEEAAERARKEGVLRIWIFGVAGLGAWAFLFASGAPYLSLAPLPPAVLGALTSWWRLSILRDRVFSPFPKWLKYLVFSGMRRKSGIRRQKS